LREALIAACPYGCHDSAVSWKLAQHAHPSLFFDFLFSILTSIIFLSVLGEDHQHHDSWGVWRWLWHPGGRCDGHYRETFMVFLGSGKETEEADSSWGRADRCAGTGFNT